MPSSDTSRLVGGGVAASAASLPGSGVGPAMTIMEVSVSLEPLSTELRATMASISSLL